MPTYDYLCPNDHRFEVIHSVTASGPEVCPVCGASPVRKAFSAPTIHFKGTGWAKKDRSATSRTHKPAASTTDAAEGGSTPAAGSTSSTGGDSKDASAGTSAPKPSADSSAKGSPGAGTGASD